MIFAASPSLSDPPCTQNLSRLSAARGARPSTAAHASRRLANATVASRTRRRFARDRKFTVNETPALSATA